MNKNFEIGQSNELIKLGKIYDLHNLYDYVAILLNNKKRTLEIIFEPNIKYGNGGAEVHLFFEGIHYLEFSSNFGSKSVSYIEEVGYISSENHDDSWLLTQQQSSKLDHFFLRLVDGEYIRVYSDLARLEEIDREAIDKSVGLTN